MSLLSLLFNRAIKIAPVHPIQDNSNEPIMHVGDMDTDTGSVCSDDTELYLEHHSLDLNPHSLEPDLEPGDYYLHKIRRNMGHVEDEEIINIEDVEPDIDVNRLYYIYNERFADLKFIDSLV